MDTSSQDIRSSLYCFLSRPRLSLLHLAVVALLLLFLDYAMTPVSSFRHLKAVLPSDQVAMINSSRCRSEVEAFRNVTAYLNSPAGLPTKALSQCSIVSWSQGGAGRHLIDPHTNEWGICNAESTVVVNPRTGKRITWDEAVYAYDQIFEDQQLFRRTSWMGVPLQQDPTDAFTLAALIWTEQPDLVIEIGTNSGGGALFYSSIMRVYNPKALLVTIDINSPSNDWSGEPPRMSTPFPAGIASHAQSEKAFLLHRYCPGCAGSAKCSPFWPGNDAAGANNIEFLLGRSTAEHVLRRVEQLAQKAQRVMVMQDGSHDATVVAQDLEAYDRFLKPGSYMVVQDTKLDRLRGRPKGPLTGARNFMKGPLGLKYRIDKRYEFLLYSQHHNGFLLKVQD